MRNQEAYRATINDYEDCYLRTALYHVDFQQDPESTMLVALGIFGPGPASHSCHLRGLGQRHQLHG